MQYKHQTIKNKAAKQTDKTSNGLSIVILYFVMCRIFMKLTHYEYLYVSPSKLAIIYNLDFLCM